MASLKEIKGRIASVDSTKQITSAMKMVASAKLHKAQESIENMLPYERKLSVIMTDLIGMEGDFESPLILPRMVGKVAIVVFSSNSSLCGAFNANIIKRLHAILSEYSSLGTENIRIYPVGKKVAEAVRKAGLPAEGTFDKMAEKPGYDAAAILARRLMGMYIAGEIDKVELIYHHFKSSASQIITRETYLPVTSADVEESHTYKDYIIEPSRQKLIAELLPKVLCVKLYTVLLDSNASEHAARTIAMQIATDNADELLKELRKQYNKSRQQAVTNELLDIVGGSMN
ncbi:MAG: F0F1 ATP synthase subunit gamma [Bacteroides sp.]|nr:F0F1 ATP synthase subunit gamma [Bacteroides sp.]